MLSADTNNSIRRNSVLLILLIFAVTYFIYTDFGIRQILGYGVLGLLLLPNMTSRIRLTRTKSAFLLLIGSNLLFFCLPNAKYNQDAIAYMLAMVIMAAYLLFALYDRKTVEKALGIAQAAGIVFMLVFLFFRVFPGVYRNYIYPFLSDTTQKEATKYMARGYGIPMAGGYTYANYVFFLSFAVSVGKLFCWHSLTRRGRILALCAAASSLVGMLLMGRRSELICLVLTCCFVLLLYRKKGLTAKKLKLLLLLPLAAVAGLVVLLRLSNFGFLSRYVDTLQKILSGNGLKDILGGANDITSGRMELWGIALEQFRSAPLLGIGYFRFVDHIPAAFIAAHGAVTNVHNDYLQHLCETGIVGTLLWILPLLYLLRTGIRQAKRLRSRRAQLPPAVTVLNIVALSTQLFFALLGFLDPAFYARKYWVFYTIGIICLEFSLQLEKAAVTEVAHDTGT